MKRVKHSAKLSEIEIDMRLKEYFSDHQIMQRSDFQGITGMVRSTAMIHIRRLRQEGKPQNIGIPSQPTFIISVSASIYLKLIIKSPGKY